MKKRNTIKLLVFALIGIGIFACNPTCENKKAIFFQEHHTMELDMSKYATLLDFLNDMDKKYCLDKSEEAWPLISFDSEEMLYSTKANSDRTIGIEPNPCVEFEYDLKQILEIIKDDNNYMIEQVRVPLDSVHNYVTKHYLNYGKDKRFSNSPEGIGIWIITYEATPTPELIPLMEEIATGIDNVCEQYAKDKYSKNICKLDDKEYLELKNLFPFHLAFKTYDKEPEIQINW